ncbi:hypothetical protein [Diaphorobacter sp.]|uniref:hypothetical protein n=1 Tax=Diaphorobacter sp. TaxID=1934310 RepID=UPI003D0A746B
MTRHRSWFASAASVGMALALFVGAGSAQARSDVYWSVGVGVPGVVVGVGNAAPVYYAPPAPVYYAPPPVVYAPPVYRAPRPVYYAPPAVVAPHPGYYRDRSHAHGHRHGHGYRHQNHYRGHRDWR